MRIADTLNGVIHNQLITLPIVVVILFWCPHQLKISSLSKIKMKKPQIFF